MNARSSVALLASGMVVLTGCTVLDGLERSLQATPATMRFCSDTANFDENSQFGMSRNGCLLHLNTEVARCRAEIAGTETTIQACAESRYQANRIPEG